MSIKAFLVLFSAVWLLMINLQLKMRLGNLPNLYVHSGCPVNIFKQRELQNADEDDFGKVLHNLMIQRLLRFPFPQVQRSMRKHAEIPQNRLRY